MTTPQHLNKPYGHGPYGGPDPKQQEHSTEASSEDELGHGPGSNDVEQS